MSYSNLKKSLKLYEELVHNKSEAPKKVKNSSSFKSKRKHECNDATIAFNQIRNIIVQTKYEGELSLIQMNLERLHKLDRTSYVDNIASKLMKRRQKHLSYKEQHFEREERTVFTEEDFVNFECEYFQN